jgi:nicotinate-nucleotide adenylyltransferase
LSRRIGLLTGTFDPIHLGHIELAEAALRVFELERALIWVNAEAPHKVGVTPYADRLAMTKFATGGHDGIEVYEGELSAQPHNMSTFLKLAGRYADAELCYIVGADTFANIYRWDDVQSVVEHTTFLLAERGSKQAHTVVRELSERLGASSEHLRVELFEFAGHNEASSLRVRAQLRAAGRPDVIDPRVYQYILENRLYRA